MTDYPRFSNYDALEVPPPRQIHAIGWVTGAPISFLDKHNPDQFVLLGMAGILE